MRICHASNFLTGCHKKTGGAESACYLVAKGLEKRGITSTTLTLKHDIEHSMKNVKEIFSMENLFGKKLGRGLKILFPFDPFIYFSSKKIFKELKPDILHLHNFSFLTTSIILAAKKMDIPIIYSIYDYWMFCPTETLERANGTPCESFQGHYCRECFKGRRLSKIQGFLALIRKPIFNWFLKNISAFITLSQNSKDILIKYGISAEKIQTIHLPILNKLDIKAPKKIEENSIFFAGWIERRKGLHIIIKAMPEILKKIPSVKLYALGIWTEKRKILEIKNMIKELNLEKSVFFTTKRLLPDNFKNIFSRASIVLVPEQWVNMSPVMLFEAMSFSKPIIASNIGGIPEFVKNGVNGQLVGPKDVNGWAGAVCDLFSNKEKLDKMRVNSRKMFKKIYDPKRSFKKLIELYRLISENERELLV